MKEQPPLVPRHLFEYKFSHAAPETPGNDIPDDVSFLRVSQALDDAPVMRRKLF
jgi:hypothetical protein